MRRSWNSFLAATCLASGLVSLAIVSGTLPAQEPSLETSVSEEGKPETFEPGISVSEEGKPETIESGIPVPEEGKRDDPIFETSVSRQESTTPEIPSAGAPKGEVSKSDVSVNRGQVKVLGDSPDANARLLDEAAKSATSLNDIRKLYQSGDKVPMRAVIETRIKSRMIDTLHSDLTLKPAKSTLPTTSEAKRTLDRLRSRMRSAKGQPSKADPEAEKVELDRALTNYFISDMKARVSELDKIKARVKELEGQLERRMKAKNEIIELQKKVLLSEVDGLGFFAADDHDEESADISLDISESELEEPSPEENPNRVTRGNRRNGTSEQRDELKTDNAPGAGLQKR